MNRKPFVLTISNRKGGTGKTTTSVNLAVEIAKQKRKVLLIDLDTQGHASCGLGIKVGKNDCAIHRMFSGCEFHWKDAIRPTSVPNLSFVPADEKFEHYGLHRNLLLLSSYLEREEISTNYDLILLDTPPSQDLLLMNALAAAHGVLIPFIPHYLSGKGIIQLANLIYKISNSFNRTISLLGLIPIMVDGRKRMHKEILEEVRLQFGDRRLLHGIRNDIRVAESFRFGKPIGEYAPQSGGAEDYKILAKSIITDVCCCRLNREK